MRNDNVGCCICTESGGDYNFANFSHFTHIYITLSDCKPKKKKKKSQREKKVNAKIDFVNFDEIVLRIAITIQRRVFEQWEKAENNKINGDLIAATACEQSIFFVPIFVTKAKET